MSDKGKPKPKLPLQNKRSREKANPDTKRSKRKTNYKSFFDFAFHRGVGQSILSELNRIQNALLKKSD